MGGLIIRRRDSATGVWREVDLRNLSIGNRLCSEMSREELWRAIKSLKVHGINPDDGFQALLEKFAEHLARVRADDARERIDHVQLPDGRNIGVPKTVTAA